jgi:hypothetical protein
MDPAEAQRVLDDEHLRLLRLGYLVEGWINVAFAFFPLIYVAMGLFITAAGTLFPAAGAPPAVGGAPGAGVPEFVGALFIAVGLGISGMLALFGILRLLTARALRERRSRTFCMVIAALTCLSVPYGTILGVCTLVVLSRPRMIALFGERQEIQAPVFSPPPG